LTIGLAVSFLLAGCGKAATGSEEAATKAAHAYTSSLGKRQALVSDCFTRSGLTVTRESDYAGTARWSSGSTVHWKLDWNDDFVVTSSGLDERQLATVNECFTGFPWKPGPS
jgi:hypothetical protein